MAARPRLLVQWGGGAGVPRERLASGPNAAAPSSAAASRLLRWSFPSLLARVLLSNGASISA
eukprot:4085608-Prymnesium_polylepis.1